MFSLQARWSSLAHVQEIAPVCFSNQGSISVSFLAASAEHVSFDMLGTLLISLSLCSKEFSFGLGVGQRIAM